jgi:hypothetical protein
VVQGAGNVDSGNTRTRSGAPRASLPTVRFGGTTTFPANQAYALPSNFDRKEVALMNPYRIPTHCAWRAAPVGSVASETGQFAAPSYRPMRLQSKHEKKEAAMGTKAFVGMFVSGALCLSSVAFACKVAFPSVPPT